MTLPSFRYHPDPLAAGSIRPSENACACCGHARGFVYVGPVFGERRLRDALCPWCIASGEAHEKLGVSFTDEASIGGHGSWDDVPTEVVAEVAFRTPGFVGWQQSLWWTHCGDAAEFMGPAGSQEVMAHGAATIERLRKDLGWEPGDDFDDYVRSLSAEGQPTAYLFRCTQCGEVGGYSDFT